jgi:hypothetical protein
MSMPSPIFIHYRDTVTGIEATERDDYPWPDDDAVRHQYGFGNYGCDDNRSVFLCAASGGAYDEELDCNGGAANRIVIDWIKDAEGRVIYSDAERDAR